MKMRRSFFIEFKNRRTLIIFTVSRKVNAFLLICF